LDGARVTRPPLQVVDPDPSAPDEGVFLPALAIAAVRITVGTAEVAIVFGLALALWSWPAAIRTAARESTTVVYKISKLCSSGLFLFYLHDWASRVLYLHGRLRPPRFPPR
jgi:hypothetical protein